MTFYKVTNSTTTAEILPKHNGSENVAKKNVKSGTMTHVINRRKFHTQPGQNGIALLMMNLAVAIFIDKLRWYS